MDIRTLKQFLTLADTLHFGRASELSHVSSSALSRSIKQLEETLGVALFERDNRTVTLTREGEKFQAYARDAVDGWEAIRNELMAGTGELHGEISMYCSVTASYSFLYEMLSQFRSLYPRIEIKLHTGDPEHAIARIQAGQEDISIAARPEQLAADIAFKPIAESPLLFIAPLAEPTLDALLSGPLTAEYWARIPMILSESGVSRQRLDRWFRSQGIKPTIYAQVAGNEAIVSMVSLGFGVGVVPKIVLDNSPLAERVRVLDVQPQLEPYQVGLFALEKKLKSPLISAFWSQLPEGEEVTHR
ncbi:HTH-type transcriptional activator IlvY [Marinobacterium arenosum]|uniref:HTH-type transcriptional activator IlvY n=1 Tax=Marinobacterium arenosum TaxID=2862496 RepID=UPI001C94756C|nr:HTH-type transcriptional activator IlvY [Marinobacterium arenosum]MBY4675622.1 HTH-type transcriptional activator IlvY [Marinobacterium arenosum]